MMRKLNVYDDIAVTNPKIRLKEVQAAEKVLMSDFKEAEKMKQSDCPYFRDVCSILLKRKNSLEQYKRELLLESNDYEYGLIDYDNVVFFKDIQVERAVREKLAIFMRPVLKEDVKKLTDISIEGATSLEGLQYAENIESITLTWTDIFTDLESDREAAIIFSLIRPTLKSLYVSHSVINQYTALSVLYNLENLHLMSNYGQDFDFSTIGLLTKINELVISENFIPVPIKAFVMELPNVEVL